MGWGRGEGRDATRTWLAFYRCPRHIFGPRRPSKDSLACGARSEAQSPHGHPSPPKGDARGGVAHTAARAAMMRVLVSEQRASCARGDRSTVAHSQTPPTPSRGRRHSRAQSVLSPRDRASRRNDEGSAADAVTAVPEASSLVDISTTTPPQPAATSRAPHAPRCRSLWPATVALF